MLVAVGSVSLVAITVFAVTSERLVAQREDQIVTTASRNALWLSGRLADPRASAVDLLTDLGRVGEAQRLFLADGLTAVGVGLAAEQVPAALQRAPLEPDQVVSQRFRVSDTPYLGVAVQLNEGRYIEVHRLRTLDQSLRFMSGALAVAVLLAAVIGAWGGLLLARRLMKPIGLLTRASQRIASGDLAVRLPATSDPDLNPIAEAFNEMADSVRTRIEREQRFAANASHELRTPLAVAHASLELLQERPLDESARPLVVHAADSARRLTRLAEDLVELHRLESAPESHPSDIDVAEIVRDVAEEVVGHARVVHGSSTAVAMVDERHLRRILINLMQNAQTHGGGVTDVVIEQRQADVVIDVMDAGPGLAPALRHRVFEPFVRGTSTAAGSGLGLAIVAEHAAAIGAHVELLPRATGGLIARVTVPSQGAPR